MWGTIFSITSCTAVFVRQEEDPWNFVIAGAATHGFLHLRMGLGVAGRRAVYGSCLLALIEGGALMLNRVLEAKKDPPPLPAHDPNLATAAIQPAVSPAEVAASSGGGGSWFGGLFGKKEKKSSGSEGKSEILESFETPSPPVPSSEYK